MTSLREPPFPYGKKTLLEGVLEDVDDRDEVKAFLSSRRAKITPERAGLTSYSRNRRVP